MTDKVSVRADGPYCPVPQPDCYPAYIEEIYPAAWAMVEDNGVIREATSEELIEISDCYSPSLFGAFVYAIPNKN